VHVRHVRVRPRDELAFTWHDQELAGSSGEVCPREHIEEALSRGGIGRRRMSDSRRVGAGGSPDLLARSRPSHRGQSQGEQNGTARGQLRGDAKGSLRRHGAPITSN